MQIKVFQDLEVSAYRGERPYWLTGGRRSPMWVTTKPFICGVDDEIHEVEEGFIFDGSTVPTPLWWLYPPSFPPAFRGSCLHDKGVAFAWKGKPQSYWDDALYYMMLHDGAKRADARIFRTAVGLRPRGAYR